jgi:hypothetical protein
MRNAERSQARPQADHVNKPSPAFSTRLDETGGRPGPASFVFNAASMCGGLERQPLSGRPFEFGKPRLQAADGLLEIGDQVVLSD